ncbi:uncharacterized protein LOC116340695 isoform X2 [Contarinia nasturtii]|uniref:uncharacterized protein LOC116340695 isoform X2 n=1 Tax=Contarinia nasturtii TaxID=265458 RepID=UPI0012D45F75|nr:uncharacterized protein LOC116340695 isoform X2 [Contarinia nasturtii]
MHLILYLLLPLVVVNEFVNAGPNTRDVTHRPQRKQQRKAKLTTTTTIDSSTASPSQPSSVTPSTASERAIGSDFVPRDIIKFELADAKVPDFASQQRYKQPQQTNSKRPRQRKARRHESSTSTEAIETSGDDKSKVSNDQSGSDSRVLTIAHPVPASTFDSKHTIKYYFKDPTPKTKQFIGVDRLPAGAKLLSDSRIKQWWQPPPGVKSTLAPVSYTKISPTTVKPTSVSSTFVNDYVAYPLLRAYPVQYSMNVASDLVNGVGFLYGDRIFSKPYTYQKNVSPVTTVAADVKPVNEPKPFGDDDIVNGVYRTTQTSILSTSPVIFPTSTEAPRTQTFVKIYSAELPERIPTNPDTGIALTNDKNTIHLINKAINDIKRHNPHLNVVPKRLEKDELVVHVTPKPEYFSKSTTVSSLPSSTASLPAFINHSTKDFSSVTDKNLVYLNKVLGSHKVNKPHIAGHAFVTHSDSSNYDDLVESGYAFGYRVRDYNTGNDFGHTQKRMMDGTTMGEYKILMPDGRTQNVKYKADSSGYQADVSYDV